MSVFLYGWPEYLNYKQIPVDNTYKNSVKLSIVIPTLNQGETLEHTLLSIIHQDYTNHEIIVVDGGSNDSTIEIVNKYREWISFFMTGKDKGQSDAINKGFGMATGHIYAWINSDDYYLPSAFSKVVNSFSHGVDILVGAGDVITKDCKFLKHIHPLTMVKDNLVRWTDGDWIMQQSCFWTAEIWKRSGGVDETLKLLMDIDLWFRFAKLGKCIAINETLAAMRYYPQIKTVSLKEFVKEEVAYVLAKNGEYERVRKLVRELVETNKLLVQQDEKNRQSISRRVLRRMGIQS